MEPLAAQLHFHKITMNLTLPYIDQTFFVDVAIDFIASQDMVAAGCTNVAIRRDEQLDEGTVTNLVDVMLLERIPSILCMLPDALIECIVVHILKVCSFVTIQTP